MTFETLLKKFKCIICNQKLIKESNVAYCNCRDSSFAVYEKFTSKVLEFKLNDMYIEISNDRGLDLFRIYDIGKSNKKYLDRIILQLNYIPDLPFNDKESLLNTIDTLITFQ